MLFPLVLWAKFKYNLFIYESLQALGFLWRGLSEVASGFKSVFYLKCESWQ